MQEFEKHKDLASIIEWFANNVPCPGTPWNKLLHEINTALALPDEQGDAIPADLEQRAKIKKLDGLHDLLLGHLEKMTISSQELFDEKKSNPKDKRGALRAAWNKLSMVLFDAKVTVHTIKEITHPNTPKSGELKPAPQASSLEGETTCVFCEMPCEPAPTKRGWSSVRYGKGLHFDCAGKVVDQGNIIGMKELEELGKDPTI